MALLIDEFGSLVFVVVAALVFLPVAKKSDEGDGHSRSNLKFSVICCNNKGGEAVRFRAATVRSAVVKSISCVHTSQAWGTISSEGSAINYYNTTETGA
jgi:hypothetical protein